MCCNSSFEDGTHDVQFTHLFVCMLECMFVFKGKNLLAFDCFFCFIV